MLVGIVALGLNVPAEELQRASTASDLNRAERQPMLGPEAIRLAGPQAPSVPALALRSAENTETAAAGQVASSPIRLRVPAIGVDAPVVRAGVDAEGQFEVPGPNQVGWYEHGPLPGAPGSSVLAAHVDLGHEPGAFFLLHSVLPGDRVYIDFDDGSSATFEIIGDTLYDKTALPEHELFRRDGEAVIQLVTCGGTFDSTTRHYRGNRVVTARPM